MDDLSDGSSDSSTYSNFDSDTPSFLEGGTLDEECAWGTRYFK